MPEDKDKKTPREVAMEKDCIVLVAGSFIIQSMGKKPGKVKCIGPECGQYNAFGNYCGFSK